MQRARCPFPTIFASRSVARFEKRQRCRNLFHDTPSTFDFDQLRREARIVRLKSEPPYAVEIRKCFRFEAAHVLPHHAGKCARLHGHSYRLDVAVIGSLQTTGSATGMVVDFDELGDAVRAHVIEPLDHSSLNERIANPTAELIALWIWDALAPSVPLLREIVLWETETACAVVREADARAR